MLRSIVVIIRVNLDWCSESDDDSVRSDGCCCGGKKDISPLIKYNDNHLFPSSHRLSKLGNWTTVGSRRESLGMGSDPEQT